MATIDTLVETWDTQNTVLWNFQYQGESLLSNRLLLPVGGSRPGAISSNFYNLTGSSITTELVQTVNGANSVDFFVSLNSTWIADGFLGFSFISGTLLCRWVHSGTTSDVTLTYDAYQHRWLRIRESGGTIFWDTSPDGATWTNRRSTAAPFAVTSVTAQLLGSVAANGGTGALGSVNFVPASPEYVLFNSGAAVFNNVGTTPVTTTVSQTIAGNSGANTYLFAFIGVESTTNNAPMANYTRAVTYNGVAMTRLGSIDRFGDGYGGTLFYEMYYLNNPTAGTHNLQLVLTHPGDSGHGQFLIGEAYDNVISIGTPIITQATTTFPSAPLPIQPNGTGLAGFFSVNTFSNPTALQHYINNAHNLKVIVQDDITASPLTIAATIAAGSSYAGSFQIALNGLALPGKGSGGAYKFKFHPTGLVTRDQVNGNLLLGGQKARFFGANVANDIGTVSSANGNAYGGTVVSGNYITTHSQVDAVLNSAQAMGMSVIKATLAVKTTNLVNAVQPTLGVFNTAALDPIDYTLQQCALRGIKVVIPFCEQYTSKPWYVSVTGGGSVDNFYTRTATINAYKAHISFVLNHINQYTGIALKNDPTVLCWATGNELLAGAPGYPGYSVWGDDIGHHIKVVEGALQLVQDGHYGFYDGSTVPAQLLSQTWVDIYEDHTYDSTRTPGWLAVEADSAHSYGKAYTVGEFTWTDKDGSGNALSWTLDSLLSKMESDANFDIGTFWDLLAPLTNWGDKFTLHFPGDSSNSPETAADMADRVIKLTRHAKIIAGTANYTNFLSMF